MKNLILLISLVVSSTFLFCQTFAPTGASWYFSEGYSTSGDTGFIKVESIGDTLINGQLSSVLSVPENCLFHGAITSVWMGEVYLYSTTDSVFLYHPFIDSFQLLYAFDAQVGDSWSFLHGFSGAPEIDTITISVDSVFSQIINSQTIRSLKVTYVHKSSIGTYSKSSTILEQIGDIFYLFNFTGMPGICDENHPEGLRCYSDISFGSYETGVVDSCEHEGVYVGMEELESSTVSVWPNPATSFIDVYSSNSPILGIRVFDILGKLVLEINGIRRYRMDVNVSILPDGVYIIQIESKNGTTVQKFIKTQ